nr:MAG TPA: hypothetical protein [Caudoviricetes sp.]DAS43291.1 MAG TPA: hypothetical protein [Caudoviricetes sp.]
MHSINSFTQILSQFWELSSWIFSCCILPTLCHKLIIK